MGYTRKTNKLPENHFYGIELHKDSYYSECFITKEGALNQLQKIKMANPNYYKYSQICMVEFKPLGKQQAKCCGICDLSYFKNEYGFQYGQLVYYIKGTCLRRHIYKNYLTEDITLNYDSNKHIWYLSSRCSDDIVISYCPQCGHKLPK